MKVTVNREEHIKPPIKNILIELTRDEARNILSGLQDNNIEWYSSLCTLHDHLEEALS